MGSSGKHFTEDEIGRIRSLLHDTDMTNNEIAGRMGCSRSAVMAVNRKFRIRVYDGSRSKWTINDAIRPVVVDARTVIRC